MKGTPRISDDSLEIPAKRYFTIGEVAELCGLKTHVLRYWETEFSQLNPVKRRGNRRYYQRDDVLMVRTIQHLLHGEGFTIAGARQKLNQSGGRLKRSDRAEDPASKDDRPIADRDPHTGPTLRSDLPPAGSADGVEATSSGPSAEQIQECRQMLESVRALLQTGVD